MKTIVLTGLVLIFAYTQALACSCFPAQGHTLKNIQESDYIAKVKFISIKYGNDGHTNMHVAKVRVQHFYKGRFPEKTKVYFTKGSSSCGIDVNAGDVRVVLTNIKDDKIYLRGHCSNTYAIKDIEELPDQYTPPKSWFFWEN